MDLIAPSGKVIRHMSVNELKEELKLLGLSSVGRKVALQGRLSEFLAISDKPCDAPRQS